MREGKRNRESKREKQGEIERGRERSECERGKERATTLADITCLLCGNYRREKEGEN